MPITAIKEYIALHFSAEQAQAEPLLQEHEIAQLAWAVRSSGQTPEKALSNQGSYDLIEVRRCLSRLYCLNLLQQGEAGYEAFVANQAQNTPLMPRLTKEQYLAEAKKFAGLDKLTKDTLRVTTILTAFPLSPEARKSADAALGKDKYTFDSVEFLADTCDNIDKAKEIYPLVKSLYEQYPDSADTARITKLIQSALSHRRHYRHMLYTEGNANMFEALVKGIRDKTIDEESYLFWKQHWTINIAGFRGNESPKGSIYLTSNTHRAMQLLEQQLDSIFTNPALQTEDILNQYLLARAKLLGLDRFKKLQPQQIMLLAHLASMNRMFSEIEGKFLAIAFMMMPKDTFEKLMDAYFNHQDKDKPTPTFAPAFFQNAKDHFGQLFKNELIMKLIQEISNIDTELSEGDITRQNIDGDLIQIMLVNVLTVVACLPLYLATLMQYDEKRIRGEIGRNDPLSFRLCSSKENIIALLPNITTIYQRNMLEQFEPSINSKGEVTFIQRPKLELKEPTMAHSPSFTPSYVALTTQASSEVAEPSSSLTSTSTNKPPF